MNVRIGAHVAGVALRSSYIVGFPGETEADYEDLLAFVEAGQFDNVGVFTFSDEEGTTSFGLPDRVPAGTKERRRRRLMSLQKRISTRKDPRRLGDRLGGVGRGAHDAPALLVRAPAAPN